MVKLLVSFLLIIQLSSCENIALDTGLIPDGAIASLVNPLCLLTPDPGSNGFQSGTGTTLDPYTICTAAQLDSIGNNYLTSDFLVLKDIDLSSIADFNIIGEGRAVFLGPHYMYSGTFDGGGFEISNLTQTTGPKGLYGMFGYATNTSKLNNIKLLNASITGGSITAGGALVGYTEGEVTNCSSSGSVTSTGSFAGLIGGLIGSAEYGATVNNSSSSATVNSGQRAGGLAGYVYESTVTNSFATGDVTGSSSVGGLFGSLENDATIIAISDCYATGNVTGVGAGDSMGGLIGRVWVSSGILMTLSKTYATGNVTTASNSAGGLIGKTFGGDPTYLIIADSYSTGSVHAEQGWAGGLIGTTETTTVSRSYSTGAVTGGVAVTNLGGFVGETTTAVYNNIYWNSAAQTDADGGAPGAVTGVTGLSLAAMTSSGNFTGFDFSGVWDISGSVNSGYPFLR